MVCQETLNTGMIRMSLYQKGKFLLARVDYTYILLDCKSVKSCWVRTIHATCICVFFVSLQSAVLHPEKFYRLVEIRPKVDLSNRQHVKTRTADGKFPAIRYFLCFLNNFRQTFGRVMQ